jgi:flagellar FliJ protein
MKGFKFKLHKVLDVRKIEEDIARNELFKANKKLDEIKEEKNNLSGYQQEIYDYIRNIENQSLVEVMQARDYMFLNRQRIAQKDAELKKQLAERNRCREEYIEKKRKKEVLEKLKEKEFQRYYQETLQREQKELDDIGQQAGRILGGI